MMNNLQIQTPESQYKQQSESLIQFATFDKPSNHEHFNEQTWKSNESDDQVKRIIKKVSKRYESHRMTNRQYNQEQIYFNKMNKVNTQLLQDNLSLIRQIQKLQKKYKITQNKRQKLKFETIEPLKKQFKNRIQKAQQLGNKLENRAQEQNYKYKLLIKKNQKQTNLNTEKNSTLKSIVACHTCNRLKNLIESPKKKNSYEKQNLTKSPILQFTHYFAEQKGKKKQEKGVQVEITSQMQRIKNQCRKNQLVIQENNNIISKYQKIFQASIS